MQSDDIDEPLKTGDDSKLCSVVFDRLVARYGGNLDVSECMDEHQVVLLVQAVSGIIDNGGFQYLFEKQFKGDPHFAIAAAAFSAINAMKCADAFEDALNLFPDSLPPTDIGTRLQLYQSHSYEDRHAIDQKFWSQSRELVPMLAGYIRDNRAKFKGLK